MCPNRAGARAFRSRPDPAEQIAVERRDADADELLRVGLVEARVEMGQNVALLSRGERPGGCDQLVSVAVAEQELVNSVHP